MFNIVRCSMSSTVQIAFIHSLNKCFLKTYFVEGPQKSYTEADTSFSLLGFVFFWEKGPIDKSNKCIIYDITLRKEEMEWNKLSRRMLWSGNSSPRSERIKKNWDKRIPSKETGWKKSYLHYPDPRYLPKDKPSKSLHDKTRSVRGAFS